jgi:hypothetical protein
MHDDFSALDLLSMGGFRLSPVPPEVTVGKKRRFVMKRRTAATNPAKRGLAAIFPMFGVKMRRPATLRALQGWPVALSWPTKEFTTPDLEGDPLDHSS